MANLNKVFLMGNLTRDPELRYIPSGTAVASFTVASNRVYTSSAGEKKEETCFMRIVAWARQAELCGEYLKKGSPVFVEGRLQSRSWETPDGQKRSTIEVVAQNVQFLGRATRPADAVRSKGPESGEPVPSTEEQPVAPAEFTDAPAEGDLGEVPF